MHNCPTLCVTSSKVNVVGKSLTEETKLHTSKKPRDRIDFLITIVVN